MIDNNYKISNRKSSSSSSSSTTTTTTTTTSNHNDNDNDNNNNNNDSPCGCRGTSAFVHLGCLRRWQQELVPNKLLLSVVLY